MYSTHPDLRAGVVAAAPLLLGVFPYGIVTGVAMASVGFTDGQALAMSAFVYAGASQLAVVELLRANTPVAVVVFTALVINLRMVMFSASLATHMRGLSAGWKGVVGFLIVDPVYAVSVAEFSGDTDRRKRWYYLGAALLVWVAWMAGTAVGVVVGSRVPLGLPFDFVVPLVFIGLLVPALDGTPALAAAVVGGVVAVAGVGVPLNAGLLVATLAGIAAGLLTEREVA
jgi:4-azaleucine resistance transporter AzlC